MRRTVFSAAALALTASAALWLGACKANDTAGNTGARAPRPGETPNVTAPASGTTVVNADGVRRVTAAELQAMLEDGRAVVYDTRPKDSYDTEHVQGSLSMPFTEVEKRAGELPQDKTLVFYCT